MNSKPISSNPTETICNFLQEIGIKVHKGPVNEETFLPGILIKHGELVIDESKLKYPGDILHEAGHIAVMTPEERKLSYGNVGQPADAQKALGEEIMAICWSYAALSKLGLPIQCVFHEDGYKGASDWLIEEYERGNYIGVATLQWTGMCYDAKNAEAKNTQPFPHMVKWIRGNE